MKKYYVNKNAQTNGDHEVHDQYCGYIPKRENRIYLGVYSSCREAVKQAKQYYSNANGCYYCSRDCHTG